MEAQIAGVMFDLTKIFTYWNLLLIVGVWTLVRTLTKAFPSLVDKQHLANKVIAFLPITLCSGAMWIPGPWLPAEASIGEKVVLGLALGALTLNGDVIAKKIGLQKFLPDFTKPKPKEEES